MNGETMRKSFLSLGILLLWAVASAAAQEASVLLEQLKQVKLDEPMSFRVTDLRLRRDAIRLTLRHGTLIFIEPVEGRVTGAVFEGRGDVLVRPPDTVERQQLARFTGSPILATTFTSAYFRFTDDTGADWLRQIHAGRGRPLYAPEIVERWAGPLQEFNQTHSIRLLMDFLDTPAPPYFFARLLSERLGWFNLAADERR